MKWAGAIIGLAFALITRFEAVELKVISIGGAMTIYFFVRGLSVKLVLEAGISSPVLGNIHVGRIER